MLIGLAKALAIFVMGHVAFVTIVAVLFGAG
jgi:hypothetical protein